LVHANPKARKRIVSTDRDFVQLIDAKTSVYSPVRKLIIDESNCLAIFTPKDATRMFPRERLLDYRALVGDASDDLPGVPGVGALSGVAMLLHAPIATYFRDPAAVRVALGRKNAKIESALADGTAQEIVERNRLLMDLRLPSPCWDELDALTTRGTWDRPAFDAWVEEQRFSALDTPALIAQVESLARSAV
jgi:DNA polymerase-1